MQRRLEGGVGVVDPDMTMTDVNNLLAFTRARQIGWAAWLLDYETHPLMKKADLSPTDPYGKDVKADMGKVTLDDSIKGTNPNQWQYQGTG